MENKPDKNSVAYKTGQALGLLLVACSAAIILALTVKFIFWLF